MAMLKLLLLFSVLFFLGAVVRVEGSHHVDEKFREFADVNDVDLSKNQPHRTAFHFQPPKNWMNDPNGPMIYKGIYHLFYQYNPKGAVWGNIVWGHSTSTDLVNWAPHPVAMYPSQPSDINGVWSGSATILPGGVPAILFTGVNPLNQQLQNLALPKNLSDPYLTEWVKSPRNPLMAPNPINRINSSSFRDPTTAWMGYDGLWRVIIGSKIHTKGLAILYTSRDFVHWFEKRPLHSGHNTGMWECPDFYPVSVDQGLDVQRPVRGPGIKYVLKVSLDDTKHDYYTIGQYNMIKDKYIPDPGSVDGDSGLRYDYGKFYASKTFFDSSKNRRVLWGWINESSTDDQNIQRGWSGVQGIPRTIYLDKSRKQLIQWPVKEIQKLRSKEFHLSKSKVLNQGSVLPVTGITAAQADVEISFKVGNLSKAEKLDPSSTNPQLLCSKMGHKVKGGFGPFGLIVLASKGMEEFTSIFFRVFKGHDDNKNVVLMCSDQSRSSLSDYDKTTYGAFLDVNPVHEELSLRTLIDHSIVESFGGKGKSCITARVYPEIAINGAAHLYAFNKGRQSVNVTKLSAWSMKKAQIN